MSRTNRRIMILGAGAMWLSVGFVLAQAPQPPMPTIPPEVGEQLAEAAKHGTLKDAQLATCFTIENQNEIAASQLALLHSKNDQVKQFAQMMIDQHNDMLKKLQPFASSLPQPSQMTAANQQPGEHTAGFRGVNEGLDFLTFHKQLGEQCRSSTEKELLSKEGAEFDHCFMGMQMGAHQHMLDALTVAGDHASPEFKKVVEEGKQTTQEHLQHAKQIVQSLKDDLKKEQ